MLLAKELIMVEDIPHVTMQRITSFKCSLFCSGWCQCVVTPIKPRQNYHYNLLSPYPRIIPKCLGTKSPEDCC